MDLRKSILKRQNSLTQQDCNDSNVSLCESAAEDEQSSIYYSCTSELSMLNASETSERSSISSDADKENDPMTQRQSIQTKETSILECLHVESIENKVVEDEDPNKNIENLFLAIPEESQSKCVPCRLNVPSKIPIKTFLYSPIIRRSADRRLKPGTARRTILEPDNQPGPSKSSGSAKTPTAIPKPTGTKTKARPEPQKSLRKTITSKAKQKFSCKWCDKKFKLENALTNHQIDSCQKIPAVEMRKLIVSRENDRRHRFRTVLAPPMTKRKAPAVNLNKSVPSNIP